MGGEDIPEGLHPSMRWEWENVPLRVGRRWRGPRFLGWSTAKLCREQHLSLWRAGAQLTGPPLAREVIKPL